MGHRSTEFAKSVSGFTAGIEGRSVRRSPRPVAVGLVVMLMVSGALANVEYGAAASDDTETHFIAATDLDGDPGDEVVTVTRSSDGSTGALEARIASNGSVIWSHVVVGTVGRVRVVDVFGDGLPEVAFVHHSSEQDSLGVVRYTGGLGVTVIDGATGGQIWRFDTDVPLPTVNTSLFTIAGWIQVALGGLAYELHTMMDVEGDGRPDLLLSFDAGAWERDCVPRICGETSSRRNSAWILSGASGTLIRRILPVKGGTITPVGDLTGNGRPSLLEVGGDGIIARTPEGAVSWVNLVRAGWVHEAELDGDPGVELIACPFPPPYDDPDRCHADGAVAINGNNGAVLWRGAGRLPWSYWNLWIAGDLNGDGIDDLIGNGCLYFCNSQSVRALSGRNFGTIWIVDGEGRSIGEQLSVAVCCDDISGDGRKDVWYRESWRESSSPWTLWSRSVTRSGIDGSVVWESEPATEYVPTLYPARGDLNGNGTRDLISAEGGILLSSYEGSSGAFLWDVQMPPPAASWFGDARAAHRAGLLSVLIVDVYPWGNEPEVNRCRVHAVSQEGLLWSHPECSPAPSPSPTSSPTPTSTVTVAE